LMLLLQHLYRHKRRTVLQRSSQTRRWCGNPLSLQRTCPRPSPLARTTLPLRTRQLRSSLWWSTSWEELLPQRPVLTLLLHWLRPRGCLWSHPCPPSLRWCWRWGAAADCGGGCHHYSSPGRREFGGGQYSQAYHPEEE
jgi:hypothetical protein